MSGKVPVRLSPREHLQAELLPYEDAAARCFSRSNGEAILQLPERLAAYTAHQAHQAATAKDQA